LQQYLPPAFSFNNKLFQSQEGWKSL